MTHKIEIEIPSDGSCEKCVFYDDCDYEYSYTYCRRFNVEIKDRKTPLEHCENKGGLK